LEEEEKSRSSALLILLISLLAAVLLFVGFNAVLLLDVVDVSSVQVLSDYKDAVKDLLGMEDKKEDAEQEADEENKKDDGYGKIDQTSPAATTAAQTTAPAATQPATQPTQPVTTQAPAQPATQATTQAPTQAQSGGIPTELQAYASGLQQVNRNYVVTMEGKDDYISYRSSPRIMAKNAADTNWLGKIKNGTTINVEYIYNGAWAVYQKDGRYVFSAMYADANPAKRQMLVPS